MSDTATPHKDTVYVVNFSDMDFKDAEQFGTLVYMTQGFIRLTPQHEMQKLYVRLRSFISKAESTDYIILSGNNLVCAIALILWISYHGYANVLHWDKIARTYRHHLITNEIPNGESAIEEDSKVTG